ncbi:MAG: hypothetical protein HXS50_03900 [Theionarchaea archaeon]|nr:hypothetical protein [Theionarchaea archaeon]
MVVWAIIGLIIFVIISYILLRRSRDRCIKEFEKYHVEAILASDTEGDLTKFAYSGVLEAPIQAGNGFEVNYDIEAIENIPQLFSYLKTAEQYTGNSKYSKTIQAINGRMDELHRSDLKVDYRLNPFDMPPEASHKVYQQDLERLLVIVRFFDELPKVEMKARLAAMEKFFHPGMMRRLSRSLGNFLSFAWDRIKQILTMITGYFTKGKSADMQKLTTEAQTTAFKYTPRKYEALLENSIGMLVKIKVISPDGKVRFYRGVLKEYSDNYICVYNVFYRLPRAAEYEECHFKGLDPKVMFRVKGKPVTRDQDIEITCGDSGKTLTLENISGHYIHLSKIVADDGEVTGFGNLLGPDGTQTLDLSVPVKKVRIEYDEAFPSDVVFPRRLAVVVGRAEPRFISMESLRKLASKAKNVPVSNIKDFQSKFFIDNNLGQNNSSDERSEPPK